MRRGLGVAGRPPGSVPSSWLGRALPNAHQCGAFYGEVPGSAIAFGFGPELQPTSGRSPERLLDQEWLRLATACLLRSAGFPDEQLRPPLQLQALRRYSARSVPEHRRLRVAGARAPLIRAGDGASLRRNGATLRPVLRRSRFLAPLGKTDGGAGGGRICQIGLVGALREAPLRVHRCSNGPLRGARSRGSRSPLPAAGAGPRRSSRWR